MHHPIIEEMTKLLLGEVRNSSSVNHVAVVVEYSGSIDYPIRIRQRLSNS